MTLRRGLQNRTCKWKFGSSRFRIRVRYMSLHCNVSFPNCPLECSDTDGQVCQRAPCVWSERLTCYF